MDKLLIAEADPFVAGLLLRFAEERGLACTRAKNGEELLALVSQSQPDVLIVDAELPGTVRGWEAIQALQADGRLAGRAVISCSWLAETEVRRRLGPVAACLQKPDLLYPDFVLAIAAAVDLLARRAAACGAPAGLE